MARLLFWLMLGAFALGTEGFVIAGILPALAADLQVTVAQAGQLVTIFALVYAVAAPVLAVLAAPYRREHVLRFAMAGFALANVAAALAPGFFWLAAARALLAVFAGLYMGTAGGYAAMAVPPEQRGRAMSFLYMGMTAATIIGVPAGTWVGNALGWRATFGAVAAIAAVALAGLCLPRPLQPVMPTPTLAQRIAIARQSDVLRGLLVTATVFAGAFAVYTYLAPLLQEAADLPPGWTGWVLMLFGVAGAVGNTAGGHLADRKGPAWVVRRSPALLAALYVAMALAVAWLPARQSLWLLLGMVAVWGFAGWAFAPAQQIALMRLAPQAPPIVLSLNASAMYLGISLGAFMGSLAVAHASVRAVPWVGLAFELAALAIVFGTGRAAAVAPAPVRP
ncbi:MAG: MFS transporter [Pseudomonadota bacterium]